MRRGWWRWASGRYWHASSTPPPDQRKLERIHGEIQRKLPEFEAILMRTSEPIDLFMRWYNYKRPHMSLDYDNFETPWEAFRRKMPPAGTVVVDEQTKEEYAVE